MDFDEIFREVQFYGNLERDIFRKKRAKNEQKNHKTLSRKKITNIFSSKIFTIKTNFALVNVFIKL